MSKDRLCLATEQFLRCDLFPMSSEVHLPRLSNSKVGPRQELDEVLKKAAHVLEALQ